MFTEEEIGTTCCFATQDKVWVTGPGGERWEVYTKLADSETFFAALPIAEDAGCCGGAQAAVPVAGEPSCCGAGMNSAAAQDN
jgi:hypothetical protein